MTNAKNFLDVVKATPTFDTVEKLPLSEKIQNWFITVSDKWTVRFYSIFDDSNSNIKEALLRQSYEIENEMENTDNEIYKEELESLNIQLTNMVRNAHKSESLWEYGIQLKSTDQLQVMVNEIVKADKRTIGGIVYLLGWPLEIDWKTIQKSHSNYERVRLFEREKKDNPNDWLVKNVKDGSTVRLKDYLDNPDYKPEDYEVIREKELEDTEEEESIKEYLKDKVGL